LILLNIGANHRVGNGRIYVTLARDFARARGFAFCVSTGRALATVRLVPAPRTTSSIVASTADTQSAMNYIEKIRGERSFVLMGICSGAYFAYYTAAVDPRVTPGDDQHSHLPKNASDAVAFGTAWTIQSDEVLT